MKDYHAETKRRVECKPLELTYSEVLASYEKLSKTRAHAITERREVKQ